MCLKTDLQEKKLAHAEWDEHVKQTKRMIYRLKELFDEQRKAKSCKPMMAAFNTGKN